MASTAALFDSSFAAAFHSFQMKTGYSGKAHFKFLAFGSPFPSVFSRTKNLIPMAGAKLHDQRERKIFNNLIFCTMHAKVFQITCQRVDKENTLNEDTLAQGDGSFYDYCAEITPECRKEMIVCLVNEILPKGMFSLIGDDELVYNGGAEEWKAEWVKAIHDKARKVTTKNVMDWIGPTYQLEKELKNPLHTDSQFYLSDETYQSYAEQSAQLMEMVCNLQVGTHLYIGGVIDFHF